MTDPMTDPIIAHMQSIWPTWSPSDEQAEHVCRALSMARANAKSVLRDAIDMHREDKTNAPNPEWIMRHYTALMDEQRRRDDARKTQGAVTKTQARAASTQGTSFDNRVVPCRVKFPNGFVNTVLKDVEDGTYAETSARKTPKGASDE